MKCRKRNHVVEIPRYIAKTAVELGQSKGYIQGITSGRSLPSMRMLLNICEFFQISPSEFFEDRLCSPAVRELQEEVRGLTDEDAQYLIYIIRRMKENL